MDKNQIFIKKIHNKTHRQSKNIVLVIFIFQEMKNSNLFDKNRTQETSNAIFNTKKVNFIEL